MNPHVGSAPDLASPQPSQEGDAVAFGAYETTRVPGAQSVAAERVSHSQPAMQSSAQPASVADDRQANATPAVADENSDALDEEWVSKAKAIVEQTKADPYIESKELSRAKADYLRIRYNKQIKVEDQQQ